MAEAKKSTTKAQTSAKKTTATGSTAKAKATKPKTTKPTTSAQSTTKNTTKKTSKQDRSGLVWKIVIGVLAAIAIICWIAFIVLHCIGTGKLENGKGQEISAEYFSFKDYDYKVLIPKDFRLLNTDEIKELYGDDQGSIVAYTNDDDVEIALMKPENSLGNDDIKSYLEAMKSILELSTDVISSDYYTTEDHNIATIKYTTETGDQKFYNYITSFSVDDKLAIINFSCRDDQRDEWEKVGDEITKSLKF